MISKLASSLFRMIPENGFKNSLRAFIHRRLYKEYKTYYRNNIWELHYPGFSIKYKDVPSPALVNYLFFKNFTDRKFDIIIDAGGFMGTYGFLMAKKYPAARIYIYEADPTNFQRIKENLVLNDISNVIIEPLGLWDKKDKLKMSIGNDLGSSIVNEKSSNATVEIDVTSLDAYFPNERNKLVFIKMNIEGAEIAALNGAKTFMANNQVDLNICTDHFVDGELTYIAVEKIFADEKMPYQTLRDGIHINTHATNIK
ncbi:MAG TPA: FkbM family methyltransferase [Ferruginibacter sp.]|nr:FkbM family methyltransferase [Ferruginibacter sp.]